MADRATSDHALNRAGAWTPFLEAIPRSYAREFLVLAVQDAGRPRILHGADTPQFVLHNIQVKLREEIPCEPADRAELATAIDEAYTSRNDATNLGMPEDETCPDADLLRAAALRDADLLTTSGKSDTARFLDAVIFDAISKGASDLHIHPTEGETLIRFRADGVLVDAHTLPKHATEAVISRLKVIGGMDTAETRAPQDGRSTVTVGNADSNGASVDLRISTIPTEDGERAVVRVLDTNRGRRLADLDAIGMPPEIRDAYHRVSSRPNGMLLLTGPTGSGKTTTLYATLRRIGCQASADGSIGGSSMNIMTVEDPVEYRLSAPGIAISQSQVNRKKGMSFASGLRHILRQDPDVVMVGEIRDAETASLAIQAALTGHMVFSTLHTNDAVGAPPRLIDLGAEPYLVSSALTGVMAQRLVRTIHKDCGGSGCETCLGTGYRGRTGIFELFVLDEEAREMVAQASSAVALRKHARSQGMRSLREDGLRLEQLGITTRAEVERVTVDLSVVTSVPEAATP